MLREAAVAIVAVCLNVTPVLAQGATFIVGATGADVYKAPSTGSPIVGRAPRGAVLEVTRELGSWVRVPWPDAPDAAGFVHISLGRVANGGSVDAVRAAAGAAVRASAETAAPPAGDVTTSSRQRSASGPRPQTPVPHIIGIGPGLVSGSPIGLGATARMWRQNRVGLRVDFSRYAIGTAAGRVSALHVEPSVMMAITDRITNYFWLRPYVGAGLGLRHQSVDGSALGVHAFGGAELTHAAAPQLALSADFGYRSRQSDVNAFRSGGFGVSLSAHWYLR